MYSLLGSKYLISGSKNVLFRPASKFLVTKNIVDFRASADSWQTENDNLFSVIYLQLISYKTGSINFQINWSQNKFMYSVALKLTANDALQNLFKNTFLSSYGFKTNTEFFSYRKLMIIKLTENQLIIKLLRFSGFYYAAPVESLNMIFNFKSSRLTEVRNLNLFETSLRLNGLSVVLL